MIDWDSDAVHSSTLQERYYELYGEKLPEKEVPMESNLWYGIVELQSGKYMLFYGLFITCTPLVFDTLDAAKTAAEFLEGELKLVGTV